MNDQEFKARVFPLKDKLFRFAGRILDQREDAEDVTQDILIRLWKRKDELDEYDNIEAFAMTSVKNLCMDKLKHQQMKNKKLRSMKEEIAQETTDYGLELKETNSIVQAILGQLPMQQKMVMHLRDIEGYSTDEITEIMNLNAVAVRTNLSRARKKVREKMLKIMNYGI